MSYSLSILSPGSKSVCVSAPERVSEQEEENERKGERERERETPTESRGRGIERGKYRLEEGQRDRGRKRVTELGQRAGARKNSDKKQARGRGAGGRKDRRKERGIQKTSEGQKWDTEKNRDGEQDIGIESKREQQGE